MDRRTMEIMAHVLLAAAAFMIGAALSGIRTAIRQQRDRHLVLFRSGLALVAGADTAAVFFLAWQALTRLHLTERSRVAAGVVLAAACLFAALLLFSKPLSIFPEDSAALALADSMQQRRLYSCLWRLLAGFVLYGCWIVFVLF